MSAYLITMATGKQALWTINHLLASGAKVHALVRDPNKAPLPAQLTRAGVTVFTGDSQDVDAVFRAAQGCKGVFLNTFPIPGLPMKQAQGILEGCRRAGVESIVVTTALCVSNRAMWNDEFTKECDLYDYFSDKAAVEDLVREAVAASNCSFRAYTVLRPSYIHFDYLLPNVYGNFPELPSAGEIVHACDDGTHIPHTDGNDLGRYAAAALQDPTTFNGQEIELGHENLSVDDIRNILTRVSGRAIGLRRRTPEQVEAAKTTVFGQAFQIWAGAKDLEPVVAEAKAVEARFGIPLTSLEQALVRDKAELMECLSVGYKK
ncbi:NAD dependent epimerase [Grosmannia clavigera kw1407]|uniref:NAD dependent epimerase n=1 Tax=Grosmannia clavigera (strain kw1407 / UAMH 11150) TaxID=655863 RepID=F0XAX6_GROCL|nr:NAD dependent epimerase [Grosmannia clavigera kw1407]EFX05188.1 NAD dependent epimerase [Grosmannia clavigera kw1407]